jgi:hypothetical protein
MPDEEDKLLAKAMRDAVGAAPFGGWLGVYLGALIMSKDVCELRQRLLGDPLRVRDQAIRAVHDHGKLVDSDTNPDGSYRVRGTLRPTWRKNPSLVTITITPGGERNNDVLVRGVGKKTLVERHPGTNAAHRIAEALPRAIPEYGAPP